MRNFLVLTMFALVAGCVDAESDKGMESLSPSQQIGAYTIEASTIQRHRGDSDTVELYTPGARDIGLYDPVTDQVTTTPASSANVSRFHDPADGGDQGAGAGNMSAIEALFGPAQTNDISCRAWDLRKACHCPIGCCNNAHNCWCCG